MGTAEQVRPPYAAGLREGPRASEGRPVLAPSPAAASAAEAESRKQSVVGRAHRFFWNAYACIYDALPKYYRPYEEQVQRVVQLVKSHALPRGARVLDAGCGTGNYLARLCRQDYNVLGLDVAEHMLTQARRKMSRLVGSTESSARLCRCSLEQELPFPDAAFDCIVSINALYMVQDQQSALCEFRRVLRPGGVLVLSHPRAIPPLRSILGEHAREYGIGSVLLPAGAFAALGLFNWMIARSFAKREFTCWSREEMHARLHGAGFAVRDMEPAYACASNLLACAVAG